MSGRRLGSAHGMAGRDADEMIAWIAGLRCTWCGVPDDDPDIHAVAWRAIVSRRTRIDAQCGSCGFVVSFSAAEVRRFWARRPIHRSAPRLVPVGREMVERLLAASLV